jgi:hypothetical protein
VRLSAAASLRVAGSRPGENPQVGLVGLEATVKQHLLEFVSVVDVPCCAQLRDQLCERLLRSQVPRMTEDRIGSRQVS